MQFPASPEVENFNGLTINKIIVTNMNNQKYLMEDKVKDEDDDPLKDKRCFQSFIIYMFMYMYQKTYLSTPDTVNGIFPLFRIISLSKYSPPINFGSSIVYENYYA